METYSFGFFEILIQEEFHSMAVWKMLLCKFLSIRIVDKAQRRYRTREKAQTALHPFG
jgi:hypothetical protein